MKRTDAVRAFGDLLKIAMESYEEDLRSGAIEVDDKHYTLANRLINLLEIHDIKSPPFDSDVYNKSMLSGGHEWSYKK